MFLVSTANFGQGAPEGKFTRLKVFSNFEPTICLLLVGHIDGCMDKPTHFDVPIDAYEYAPVAGITELREKVATLYNELYRKDKTSKYTAENVSNAQSLVILSLTLSSVFTGLHCSRVCFMHECRGL
jgi:hypothetical protein